MENNTQFKITYFAKKHGKHITRNAKWTDDCKYWTSKILSKMYKSLNDYDVQLNATILKPNMILSGKDNNINCISF